MRTSILFLLLASACGRSELYEPELQDLFDDVGEIRSMSQELKLSPKGLYSQPNLIGEEIPEGALVTADNVVINREGILEPRRGVSAYATLVANRLFSYQDRLISHSSTGTVSYDDGAGAFTALTGTFAPPSSTTAKTRSAQAAQNLYLTTSAGVYRMDAYNSIPLLSGAVKATGFDRDGRVYTSGVNQSSLTSNVVTVNTSSAHGFYVGQVVTQTSATEGAHYIAGNHTVVSVPTSTSFTYAQVAANDAGNANVHTWAPAALRETVIGTPGGVVLTDGNHVAYRVVFNCPDANNTEKPGAASPRTIIANASGTPGWVTTETRDPIVRVFIPSGITTSHSVRLYRSKQVATTIEPDDDLQLVWEALVKTNEISQGWVDITDVVPDALRGALIYTAPSQQTMAQNNERPPMAKDIAVFGGSMHYANTVGTGPQQIVLNLLGVGSPNGLQSGDVVAIDTGVYTAATTPTSSTDFKVESGGSPGVNVRNTAINLVAAINRHTANTSAAFYISGPDDPPGKILIQQKALGGTAFLPALGPSSAANGIRAAWSPMLNPYLYSADLSRTSNVVTATITFTAGTYHNFLVGERVTISNPTGTFGAGPHTITAVNAGKTTFTYSETAANDTATGRSFSNTDYIRSTAGNSPNRVYYSKDNQPEAVPLLNYTDIGSKDADILRIIALRESIFAFKEDGLFRGSGSNGSFVWKLFDPTVILVAPDSAVTLGNQIYALTTQGVLAISDTGSEIVSRPIQRTLDKLMATDLTSVQRVTFGVGYETEHTYELRTISAASETTCTQAFIYNTITGAWVRDTITTKTGVIHTDGNRYLGGATKILKERKSFLRADYSDVDVSVTVSSTTGAEVVLSSASGVSAGDILYQSGPNVYARITAVVSNTLSIATEDQAAAATLTAAAATVYKAIASTVQWAPIVGKNPGASKLWQETNLLFGDAYFGRAFEFHSTELVPTFESTTIEGVDAVGQWVRSNVTATASTVTETPFNLRLIVPQEMRRSTRLNLKWAVTNAWATWNISGLSVIYQQGSPRTSR